MREDWEEEGESGGVGASAMVAWESIVCRVVEGSSGAADSI